MRCSVPYGIELVPYELDEGRFPVSLDECDGWMCSPSRHSVYDDVPWIADAEDLHREIVRDEHAYVGICFGHQLLAQALGGRVERAEDGWGVGVHEYALVESLPCMDPALDRIALIASHQDQVVDVPDDGAGDRDERPLPGCGPRGGRSRVDPARPPRVRPAPRRPSAGRTHRADRHRARRASPADR